MLIRIAGTALGAVCCVAGCAAWALVAVGLWGVGRLDEVSEGLMVLWLCIGAMFVGGGALIVSVTWRRRDVATAVFAVSGVVLGALVFWVWLL